MNEQEKWEFFVHGLCRILMAALICVVIHHSEVQVKAANDKYIKETLVPETGIYYNGHTYLFFRAQLSWDRAKQYCELLGGYLACLETQGEFDAVQRRVTDFNEAAWVGAYASGNGNTRDWQWLTGSKIGSMHEPQPETEDEFYYIPIQPLQWDVRDNEPNSWHVPWDQSTARIEPEFSLNTIGPSVLCSFVCEFDQKLSFSTVDPNFDFDNNISTGSQYPLISTWTHSPSS
jgi:hypothetical protein